MSRNPIEPEYLAFGALIKERRKERGWKQFALAAEIGVSRCTITYYETARTRIPLDKALKLCAVLDIDFAQLKDSLPCLPMITSVPSATVISTL